MIKKLLIFTFIILFLSFNSTAFAVAKLRQPQGRLGTSYKTEKYNPTFKTNISPTGLANLNIDFTKSNIKKEKQELARQKAEQAQFAKEQAEKQKLIQEQKKQELARQKAEQEKIAKEQAEKQKLIQEQKKQELARQKAEQAKFAKEQAEKQNQLKAETKLTEKKPVPIVDNEENISAAKKMAIKTKLLNNHKTSNNKEVVAKTSDEKFKFFKKLSQKEIKAETEATLTEKQQNNSPEQTKEEITTVENQTKQDPLTKSIVNEISNEIANERSQMLEDLSLLWVSAVQKSDTVYFAIIKLSNPNGEEVNKSGVKKILEPIISAAPLVGQAFVNPALTAGSLIGSNVMGTMMNDSATKRLTKVNDADLVILARSIDELQETLLVNYLAYKSALQEYELSIKITDSRKETYDKLNAENSPHVILANTFYTEALDNQYKARQEFLMKRVVLEQMVGSDALNEMEKKKVTLAE